MDKVWCSCNWFSFPRAPFEQFQGNISFFEHRLDLDTDSRNQTYRTILASVDAVLCFYLPVHMATNDSPRLAVGVNPAPHGYNEYKKRNQEVVRTCSKLCGDFRLSHNIALHLGSQCWHRKAYFLWEIPARHKSPNASPLQDVTIRPARTNRIANNFMLK